MELIRILADMITILARLIFDLFFAGAAIYILYKFVRGYDVTIELKTTKPNKLKGTNK